ncbi:putative Glutathione-dependent formaldehyde-activating enzyme [Seiridium cardinale]
MYEKGGKDRSSAGAVPYVVSSNHTRSGIDEILYTRLTLTSFWTDPKATEVNWHNDGRARCANYQFNTKQKDQMFCPKCGASLGIDFREVHEPQVYGISARTIYGINVDDLTYRKGNGMEKVLPAGDLSGHWWDEEKQEMK